MNENCSQFWIIIKVFSILFVFFSRHEGYYLPYYSVLLSFSCPYELMTHGDTWPMLSMNWNLIRLCHLFLFFWFLFWAGLLLYYFGETREALRSLNWTDNNVCECLYIHVKSFLWEKNQGASDTSTFVLESSIVSHQVYVIKAINKSFFLFLRYLRFFFFYFTR